jgi:sRNA-binding protein
MTHERLQEIIQESLRDWFKKEDWVRIDTAGNITGPCGTMKKGDATTRCLPRKKAQSLSKKERAATSRKKATASRKGKQFVSNTKPAKYKKGTYHSKKL